jgi:hypothetical protein
MPFSAISHFVEFMPMNMIKKHKVARQSYTATKIIFKNP